MHGQNLGLAAVLVEAALLADFVSGGDAVRRALGVGLRNVKDRSFRDPIKVEFDLHRHSSPDQLDGDLLLDRRRPRDQRVVLEVDVLLFDVAVVYDNAVGDEVVRLRDAQVVNGLGAVF